MDYHQSQILPQTLETALRDSVDAAFSPFMSEALAVLRTTEFGPCPDYEDYTCGECGETAPTEMVVPPVHPRAQAALLVCRLRRVSVAPACRACPAIKLLRKKSKEARHG